MKTPPTPPPQPVVPTISVVIRMKTDALAALEVLDRVQAQQPAPMEIVVVDSGSSQEVQAALESRPIRLFRIAPSEYSSAFALNRAIEEARGELIAILSQDALPADTHYLARLSAAFDSALVAGAYGRQTPRPNDHPLNRKDLETAYPPVSRAQTADCWMDNACSMIRADLWRLHPFAKEAVVAEDHEWAKWAQSQGREIRYQADAVVVHSHPRGARAMWRRSYLEGLGLAWVHQRRITLARALGRCAREVASDVVWLARHGEARFIPGSVVDRLAKHAGLYWGQRRGLRHVRRATCRS
ncbi:MAG: glycosyltransferase family 2 protein [Candidatus Sumerlaeota bacterium]|nr:glycosyltransferase family 2 protein [Candidatus Sumerlaeota bacterium]